MHDVNFMMLEQPKEPEKPRHVKGALLGNNYRFDLSFLQLNSKPTITQQTYHRPVETLVETLHQAYQNTFCATGIRTFA